MSGDKRSVKTDALETLGTLIDDKQKRDAIHLAVEPVVAAQMLMPGDDVGFVDGGAGKTDRPVGIVDPFIKGPVLKGDRFWLVVYPRQITSLRHVWTHPAFPEPAVSDDGRKQRSEEWLRSFATREDIPYEGLVAAAARNDDPDYFLLPYGIDMNGRVPEGFWDHVENVIGRRVDARAEYFTCSC